MRTVSNRKVFAMLLMFTTLCSCTKEFPEFVGTYCDINIVSKVIKNSDDVSLELGVRLDNLDEAFDEHITKVELSVNGNMYILYDNEKVADIASDGKTSDTRTVVINNIPYNKRREFTVYATLYSESGYAKKSVNSDIDVYVDKISLVDITCGTPYDKGFTAAKIPIHLSMLDSCIAKVGVEYTYNKNYTNSSKKEILAKNITSKDVNVLLSSIKCNTSVYYRCYVTSIYGNTKYTSWSSMTIPPVSTDVAVDLGLSVKWAPYNIGSFEDSRTNWYFAAGNSYKDLCGTSNDIARMYWGDNWNMPNLTHLYELRDECTWKKVRSDNSDYYKVTGPNGNSIYIPIIGYMYNSAVENEDIMYIMSGVRDGYGYIYYLRFSESSCYINSGWNNRYYPVRAVVAN